MSDPIKNTADDSKPIRQVFMIMPFVEAVNRNKGQLDNYFEYYIKKPIESATELDNAYTVRRSGDKFNITESIIRDLYQSDIVIADLSGNTPNPNVMYELGVRLALTDQPTLLVREDARENKKIFDIQGFYTHPYDPLKYNELTAYIVRKLRQLEVGEDSFRSPVLDVVRGEGGIYGTKSRSTAIRYVDLLQDQLLLVSNRFCTDIDIFATQEKGIGGCDLSVANPASSLLEHMDGIDEFASKQAFWEGFEPRVLPAPAVEFFITHPVLREVLDTDIENAFVRLLMEFHQHHAGDGELLRRVVGNGVLDMAVRLQLLVGMCTAIMDLIAARGSDEAAYNKAEQHFKSLLAEFKKYDERIRALAGS